LHVRTRAGYSLASESAALNGVAENPAMTSYNSGAKQSGTPSQ